MMGSGFGFGIPGLGMVLFWGLTVLLAVGLVRLFSSRNATPDKSAREILDERLAKGDIDPEEYEQKKQMLG